MARDDVNDQLEDDELLEEGEGREEGISEEDQAKKAIPAWGISLVAHGLILFIMSVLVFASEALDSDTPPVANVSIPPPPKKDEEKPKLERDIKTSDLELDVDTPADKPSPVSNLDVPVEDKFTREEETDSDTPKGREEATADSEMGGTGAFMAIGAGGGASGMFGSRSGGGKKRALGKFGGSKGSESAVDAALRWFKKHQSPDGRWSVSTYPANCTENPKCEPGTEHLEPDQGDVAATGYALLCFLGAGYDHRMPSKYKNTVKKGIEWLMSEQQGDGHFGPRNYENAIATMAMSECYAMSTDPALKDPAQKGVNIILANQLTGVDPTKKDDPYGRMGWDYVAPNPTRQDSSVSGWNVMALKSAAAAGLNIANGMEGAKNWLEKAWKANNPNWKQLTDPYTSESVFSYVYNPTTDKPDGHQNMAPVGALCAVFLGHHQGDMMLESLCNWISNHQLPAKYPTNTYYMYYNTLAIFQAGGPRWEKWNKIARDVLVNAQRKSQDCFDGSWDFQGTEFPGFLTGRLLSTAYCCLSLEVYYRYLPVAAKGGAGAGAPAPAPAK